MKVANSADHLAEAFSAARSEGRFEMIRSISNATLASHATLRFRLFLTRMVMLHLVNANHPTSASKTVWVSCPH